MPYDGSGNFGLVNGYRATTGQTILASQHNPPLEDIASGLSQVLLRSGVAPMNGPLNMNSFRIVGLPEASNDGDPVTLAQIQTMLAALSTVQTGTVAGFRRTTAPAGWVKENGGTIGNAASGATTRANADTEALFTLHWNEFNNTILPIQNSSGVATTRGASAAADFAANKRMPLFDSRSRFHRGADDGLGFDATLTVGATQADALKSHTHTGTTSSSGAHTHTSTISGGTGGSNITGGAATPIGNDTTSIASSGAHTHTFTTAATGDALETRPRSSVLLYCIKL